MSRVAIDWCSLVPAERVFVQRALFELGERLAVQYPEFPLLEVRELSESDREHVSGYLARQVAGAADSEANGFNGRKLFVFCSLDHEVAMAIRQENVMAEWGGARLGHFAVVWELGNPFVLWHEAMHLLYATDCYDKTGRNTCGEPRCLMQWEPCEANCTGSLVLCEANQMRIAEFA